MSTASVRITAPVLDRAAGTLVASAAGDALGAGYEFGIAALPHDDSGLSMIGGGLGNFAPGEWTDDTDMAVPVAQHGASGADLRSVDSRRAVLAGWRRWFASRPPDVGMSTRAILGSLTDDDPVDAAVIAAAQFTRSGLGAANGAIMRTGPVGVAHIGDPAAAYDAGFALASVTHADPVAGEAAGIVSAAVAVAVATGVLDLDAALVHLPADRADWWAHKLAAAEITGAHPSDFAPHGWAVACLQAAWCAVVSTHADTGGPGTLEAALRRAVMGGNDTDTVAAVCGTLVGARHGVSAVPAAWRAMLHGTVRDSTGPFTARTSDLVRWAVLSARGGVDDAIGWPRSFDLTDSYRAGFHLEPGVVSVPVPDGIQGRFTVGSIVSVPDAVADGCDLVVSLCRMGTGQVPPTTEHLEVWITDTDDPANDPNLAHVALDTARHVANRVRGGSWVHLHCVEGRSRTPTIAALVLRELGVAPQRCAAQVSDVLWWARPAQRLVRLRDELLQR
jgi:ADP-ribosyl-[dinitrogen reductase] hydrolase